LAGSFSRRCVFGFYDHRIAGVGWNLGKGNRSPQENQTGNEKGFHIQFTFPIKGRMEVRFCQGLWGRIYPLFYLPLKYRGRGSASPLIPLHKVEREGDPFDRLRASRSVALTNLTRSTSLRASPLTPFPSALLPRISSGQVGTSPKREGGSGTGTAHRTPTKKNEERLPPLLFSPLKYRGRESASPSVPLHPSTMLGASRVERDGRTRGSPLRFRQE